MPGDVTDKGKYGHTHTPGKNPAVTFEDAKEDEPEPARAPSPPARRITRNMDQLNLIIFV